MITQANRSLSSQEGPVACSYSSCLPCKLGINSEVQSTAKAWKGSCCLAGAGRGPRAPPEGVQTPLALSTQVKRSPRRAAAHTGYGSQVQAGCCARHRLLLPSQQAALLRIFPLSACIAAVLSVREHRLPLALSCARTASVCAEIAAPRWSCKHLPPAASAAPWGVLPLAPLPPSPWHLLHQLPVLRA